MKKLLSDKDSNFDMTHIKEEESDSKNVKRDTRYTWKTLEKGWKTTVWAKMECSCFTQICIIWGKEVTLVQ